MTVDNLTDNEIACLLASRNNEYGDCMGGGTWSFTICENAHLTEKVYRGVVSSLIKKGYAIVNGNRNDEVFALTKKENNYSAIMTEVHYEKLQQNHKQCI